MLDNNNAPGMIVRWAGGLAEPLFSGLNARIQLLSVMNADDLKKGLAAILIDTTPLPTALVCRGTRWTAFSVLARIIAGSDQGGIVMRNAIFASLAASLALIAVLFTAAAPAQAQKGGGRGGAQQFVCKSGHYVKNVKGCKENGGQW
jgi:hypothetical protein